MMKLRGNQMGPRPVAVAAKEAGVGFAGAIADDVFLAVGAEDIRVVAVFLGEGAQAVGGKEFLFT